MPPRLKTLPIRLLIPSLVTVLAICAGLTSMRFAVEGRLEAAILMILLAALLDGIDGRVARLLKGTSSFGAELDSLADFVNFGVAPAFLVYQSLLTEGGRVGWLAAMIFAISCSLRLARFNVAARKPQKPGHTEHFFVGVPAPAAGCLAMLPLFMLLLGWEEVTGQPYVISVYLIFVALITVSRIPTFSVKRIRIRRDLILPLIVIAAAYIALIVSSPWLALTIGCLLYLASIPLSFWLLTRRTAIRSKEDDPNASS